MITFPENYIPTYMVPWDQVNVERLELVLVLVEQICNKTAVIVVNRKISFRVKANESKCPEIYTAIFMYKFKYAIIFILQLYDRVALGKTSHLIF